MKTAVSLPDPIFHAAESLAKRLGMSRSKLFSHALEAYLEAHKHDRVREALDAIYSQESSSLDETLAHMQWASLPDWECDVERSGGPHSPSLAARVRAFDALSW